MCGFQRCTKSSTPLYLSQSINTPGARLLPSKWQLFSEIFAWIKVLEYILLKLREHSKVLIIFFYIFSVSFFSKMFFPNVDALTFCLFDKIKKISISERTLVSNHGSAFLLVSYYHALAVDSHRTQSQIHKNPFKVFGPPIT